jgi:long-chain acyl-CoA synthetase
MSDILTRLQQASDLLLQSDGSHRITTALIDGVELRVYANAPSSLREAMNAGRVHGDKTFIVYEGERWSFDRFFAEADKIGALMASRYGIVKGDRVAIAMRNYPEWMIAFMAIVSIGAIVVPLNSWGQADELKYGLTDAGAKLVFCDQQRLTYIGAALSDLNIEAVVVRPEGDNNGIAQTWEELLRNAGDATLPTVAIGPEDLAMIMYTSGTTGKPKGAASTNRAICQALYNFEFHAYSSAMANPDRIGKMMEAGFEPATLLVVPLFHVSGCFAVFLLNLRGGRKTSIMYKWDVEQALQVIEQERITTFTGVPAMSLALLESPAFDAADTRSLSVLGFGGAACPPHLPDLVFHKLPDCYPGTGYGMTETCATGASCTGDAFREMKGTAGSVSPIVDIKTVDENGRDLAQGESGEIYVRSPTNVREYWNLPEATAESFRDGWLATGDVGYVDANNFLYVVDRIKDMVIRGGENIYPVEIEGCMIEHPAVVEVTAYGVPHDSWGEELAVTVYCTGDVEADELKSWVGQRLAGFKVPAYISFQSEPLPKNATGKVLKKQVRQAYLDSL